MMIFGNCIPALSKGLFQKVVTYVVRGQRKIECMNKK